MSPQRLLIPALGLTFVAGSFAAGFIYFRSPPKPDGVRTVTELPPATVGEQASDDDEDNDAAKPSSATDQRPKNSTAKSKPSAKSKPRLKNPLTRADAARLGEDCIGERVTWTGERATTQSARVEQIDGTQHIIKAQLPNGEYSFNLVFIVEEPIPFERKVLRPRTKEELHQDLEKFLRFQKSTGLKGANAVKEYGKLKADTVTVTGTISRLTTLFLIGEGTFQNVPVLTDAKILHTNPNW